MTKLELSRRLARDTGLTYVQSALVTDAVFRIISEALSLDDRVKIEGFGVFETAQRSERKGRDLNNDTTVIIPARKVPVFRPGKRLKEVISNG